MLRFLARSHHSCSASKHKLNGFNIDWEPASGDPTASDAANYAKFLDELALALAPHGVKVSVDAATWYASPAGFTGHTTLS